MSRAASIAALAREHLAAGRPLKLSAEGHSMWPLIRHGDLVVIRPALRPPALGDVILIVLADRLVLHRVVRLTPAGVITKGDAVARPDGLVRFDAILGHLAMPLAPAQRMLARLSRSSGPVAARLLQALRRRLNPG